MKRLAAVLAVLSTVVFGVISASQGDSASRLAGNHPRAAELRSIVSNADANQPLAMEIHLRPRNEAQLGRFLEELQDPHSPNYHQFLQPGEFDRKYGPLPADVNAVAEWMRNQGFSVTTTPWSVQVSGTIAQAERAFAVRIMKMGAAEYSNLDDPMIPAQLAPLVGHIEGLDNLMASSPVLKIPLGAKSFRTIAPASHKLTRAEALAKMTPTKMARGASPLAQPDVDINGSLAYGDIDMRNTYDVPSSTTMGSGDCIAIVGESDILDASLSTFQSQFSDLPAFNVTRVAVGANPGMNSAETEADLDLEWSHVMAPGAPLHFYLGSDLTKDITQAVTDDTCKVISISFEFCGGSSTFYTSTLDTIFKKAAGQGQTVFVSSGDNGAAGSTPSMQHTCVAAVGPNPTVSEMASDTFVTAVGGTQILSPAYNGSGIAQGYAAETVWNDPERGFSAGGATGGGASALFSKPSYQAGPGVPNDGHRDIPDVAMLGGAPAVFIGGDSGGSAALLCCIDGTSLAAPLWAGIAKDLESQLGALGSINPKVYAMANLQYGASPVAQGFHDITSGDNTFNGVTGFSAETGYDQNTGWGSVDFNAFVTAFAAFSVSPTPTPTPTPVLTTTMVAAPATVNFGNVDATGLSRIKKIKFTNRGQAAATIGSVSVPAPFTNAGDACSGQTVAPRRNCQVMVQFSPGTPGAALDSLTVSYNGGTASSSLSGNGTAVSMRAPTRESFGPVAAGSTGASKTITIINLSKVATVMMGATPGIVGPFAVTSDLCSGVPLSPHGRCQIKVASMPAGGALSKSATSGSLGPLSFTYGSNLGSVPAITLSGKVK